MLIGSMNGLGRRVGAGALSRFSSVFGFTVSEAVPASPATYPLLPDAEGSAFRPTRGQLLGHIVARGPTGPERSRCLIDIAAQILSRGAGLVHVANGPAEPAINALLRMAESKEAISLVDVVAFDGSTGRPSVQALMKSLSAGRIVSVWLPGPAFGSRDNLRAAHAFVGMLEAAVDRSSETGRRSRRLIGIDGDDAAPTMLLLDDPAPYAECLSTGFASRMTKAGIGIVYGIEDDESFGAVDRTGAAEALAGAASRIDLGGPAGPAMTYAGVPMPRNRSGAD